MTIPASGPYLEPMEEASMLDLGNRRMEFRVEVLSRVAREHVVTDRVRATTLQNLPG